MVNKALRIHDAGMETDFKRSTNDEEKEMPWFLLPQNQNVKINQHTHGRL